MIEWNQQPPVQLCVPLPPLALHDSSPPLVGMKQQQKHETEVESKVALEIVERSVAVGRQVERQDEQRAMMMMMKQRMMMMRRSKVVVGIEEERQTNQMVHHQVHEVEVEVDIAVDVEH